MRPEEIELLLESQAAVKSQLDLGKTTDLVAAVMSAKPNDNGYWVKHCLRQLVRQSGDPDVTQDLLSLYLVSQKGWSYASIVQLFNIEKTELAQRLWGVRLELVSRNGIWTINPGRLSRDPLGVDCPEVDSMAPWMQSYLDRDISGPAAQFIESHLLQCQTCQERMKIARQIWVAVERVLPRPGDRHDDALRMHEALRPLRAEVAREEISQKEWVKLFFARTEVRFGLGAMVILFVLERAFRR